MELQITHNQDAAISTIIGHFTYADHVHFSSVLALVEIETVSEIIIDIGKMEFIDSAGLGMLLMLLESCQDKKKRLTLLNPVGQVRKVFSVARFDEIFTVESSNL